MEQKKGVVAKTPQMIPYWLDSGGASIYVLNTRHDIPSSKECRQCHQGNTELVLGFEAIQLSDKQAALAFGHGAGKRHLLSSLWQQFSDKHGNYITRLKSTLESGDIKQACALLHNLKGIAGNIGALTLSEQTEVLNRQLKEDENSYLSGKAQRAS